MKVTEYSKQTTKSTIAVDRKRSLWSQIKRDKYLYLLLLPMVAYYILFNYKPMYGLQIAFKEFNPALGITASSWIDPWYYYFQQFFGGPYFVRLLKNTLILNGYMLLFAFPLPIILALMLNEVKSQTYKKLAQTFVYVPHFISMVVVAGLVTNFLSPGSGIINLIIEKFGGEKVYFLIKPEYFRPIYVLMHIWKEVGFNSIIYIAALAAVDMELYEAARIDGAGRWKQLWHVTLPGILPTVIIMLILRIGHLLDIGYEAIILLYQPVTFATADVFSSYVYREAVLSPTPQYSLAAAVGLFNGVVALILVLISNTVSKKVTEISLW